MSEAAPGSTGRARIGRAGVVVLAVSVLLVSTIVGYAVGSRQSRASVPTDDSAAAGFARDMQTHHAQAVEMALLVRDRSRDPTIRAIAYDIATSQQQQIGQMYAWLELWGLSQTGSEEPMSWMRTLPPHDMSGSPMRMQPLPDGRMPGMASAADLDQLRQVQGEEADSLWLALMVEHHLAGVQMAEAAGELVDDPAVRRLAEAIVVSQQAEIRQLRQLQDDRG